MLIWSTMAAILGLAAGAAVDSKRFWTRRELEARVDARSWRAAHCAAKRTERDIVGWWVCVGGGLWKEEGVGLGPEEEREGARGGRIGFSLVRRLAVDVDFEDRTEPYN